MNVYVVLERKVRHIMDRKRDPGLEVCAYSCVQRCVCIHMYKGVCVYSCVQECVCIHVSKSMCVHIYVSKSMCVCTHVYKGVCVFMCKSGGQKLKLDVFPTHSLLRQGPGPGAQQFS